jgi:protein-S-isoprenylcysteine O-methyltransferase Ste14
MTETLLLLVVWGLYFLCHSLAASLTLKGWVARRFAGLMPWYRLTFNALALILLIPPLWLTWSLQAEPLWQWQGGMAWLAWGLTLVAVLLFAISLRYYDGSEFFGTRQLREGVRSVEDQERLHISPLHRHVRHPWYSIGLLLIWTRDMDGARLVSALAITAYLVIGGWLEERKLIVYHGERYRRYRQRVPGLVPLPWRRLTPAEAASLERGDF